MTVPTVSPSQRAFGGSNELPAAHRFRCARSPFNFDSPVRVLILTVALIFGFLVAGMLFWILDHAIRPSAGVSTSGYSLLGSALSPSMQQTTQLVAALALDESQRTNGPIFRESPGENARHSKAAGKRIDASKVRPWKLPSQSAHMRSALKRWTAESLQAVGRWTAANVERVRLSTMAMAESAKIAGKAFEFIKRRARPHDAPKTFICWVQKQRKDSRTGQPEPLEIVGIEELAADDELSYALDQFLAASPPGVLLPVSNASGDARIRVSNVSGDTRFLSIFIRRFGEHIASGDLVDLLDSSSREVRLQTVQALQKRNEPAVLARMLKSYEREMDPEIKKAHEENHRTEDRRNKK